MTVAAPTATRIATTTRNRTRLGIEAPIYAGFVECGVTISPGRWRRHPAILDTPAGKRVYPRAGNQGTREADRWQGTGRPGTWASRSKPGSRAFWPGGPSSWLA